MGVIHWPTKSLSFTTASVSSWIHAGCQSNGCCNGRFGEVQTQQGRWVFFTHRSVAVSTLPSSWRPLKVQPCCANVGSPYAGTDVPCAGTRTNGDALTCCRICVFWVRMRWSSSFETKVMSDCQIPHPTEPLRLCLCLLPMIFNILGVVTHKASSTSHGVL